MFIQKTEQEQAKAEAAVAAASTAVTMVTEAPVKKTEQPESSGAVSAIDQTPSSSMKKYLNFNKFLTFYSYFKI